MRRLWQMLDDTPPPLVDHAWAGFAAMVGCGLALCVTVAFDVVLEIQLPFLWGIAAVLLVTFLTGTFGGLVTSVSNLVVQAVMALTLPMALLTWKNIAVVGCLSACFAVIGGWQRQKQAHRNVFAEKLRIREAHLQSIFDHLPAPIVIVDAAGFVRAINAAACALFDVHGNAVFGRPLGDFVVGLPTGQRSLRQLLQDLSAGDGDRAIKATGSTTSGRALQLRLTASSVPSAAGRWLTVHLQDETEALAAAARLEDVQRQLLHVSRATALGELGSAIAHELNQPLAAIGACLGAAKIEVDRATIDRGQLTDALETSLAHTLRAGAVLKRLRVFVTRKPEVRQVIAVGAIISESVSLVQFAVRDAGVRLVVNLDPDLGAVLIDPVQVQQVLLNMIRNAIEAMSESAVRMIRVEARAGSRNDVVISVVDTGAGVAPDSALDVFAPFKSTKSDGLGVGLSIAKTIVETLGGEIGCEPNPGAGMRFWFSLPLADAGGSRLAA